MTAYNDWIEIFELKNGWIVENLILLKTTTPTIA